ncbi:ABC transporter ATP-binding protein [Candidatus Saccharibacteria bacterium]|nr:ABC transporter ATP-binding protein [Candidatus Saccharibacteria bacterium]
MIKLSQVSKVYGRKQNQFTALEGIDLKLERGTSVAIVGKSGSGKSTLMHIMSGLDKATSGTVIIDGENLDDMKSKAKDSFRANKMGFIFQSFFVQGNETCSDNIALPLEIAGVTGKKRQELVDSALERVELGDKKTTKAKNLSGGQKQRLAIARAIVNEPSILFADEPTGNLDSVTGDTIEDLLFELNSRLQCTLVIVTHDADLANKCDVRVHMKDGRIEKVTGRTKAVKK